MTDDCIFCQIVAGEIPARTVYEDDDVLAFLDVNPLARGHTLVVPKEHHERVRDLPDGVADSVFGLVPRLAPAVQRAVDAAGTTIGVNDGRAAGQEIEHVHVHIVPREEGDGAGAIHALRWPRPELGEEEFEDIEQAIREAQ